MTTSKKLPCWDSVSFCERVIHWPITCQWHMQRWFYATSQLLLASSWSHSGYHYLCSGQGFQKRVDVFELNSLLTCYPHNPSPTSITSVCTPRSLPPSDQEVAIATCLQVRSRIRSSYGQGDMDKITCFLLACIDVMILVANESVYINYRATPSKQYLAENLFYVWG